MKKKFKLPEMSLEERHEVYRKAVDKFGWESQAVAAIEEIAELIVELAKGLNGKRPGLEGEMKLIDELADARIMIEQIEMNTQFAQQVKDRMAIKVSRLNDIVDGVVEHPHKEKGKWPRKL